MTAVLVAGSTPASTAAPSVPPLRLIAASTSVTLDNWFGEGVILDVSTHVVAGSKPFVLRAKRSSYADPIVVSRLVNGRYKPLPAGLVSDFFGLPGFTHVTVKNAAGVTVAEQDQTFCPSGGQRSRPDAAERSPYQEWCSWNPFTLGNVWGIQSGWATRTTGAAPLVQLPDGQYTVHVAVAKKYQDLFGIPADQSSATVQATVRTIDPGGEHRRAALTRNKAGTALKPNAAPPTGKASVPKGPKPDLRALPAWEMVTESGDGRDFLHFAANVWNAGPSPLVVDGFRRSGENLMDAYQYFYDANGKQVGYAPVGTMEWDPRGGHEHWHFTDFAQYRLLSADQSQAVRSEKEAFCLAATDSIDTTVPRAEWRPENTDLHSACGDLSALSVREALPVGWGDTYFQNVPGQSFDITDVPNGTYYVEVMANPDRNLYEANLNNNVSLRKVILGGSPGARTVEVPPYQGVDAP